LDTSMEERGTLASEAACRAVLALMMKSWRGRDSRDRIDIALSILCKPANELRFQGSEPSPRRRIARSDAFFAHDGAWIDLGRRSERPRTSRERSGRSFFAGREANEAPSDGDEAHSEANEA